MHACRQNTDTQETIMVLNNLIVKANEKKKKQNKHFPRQFSSKETKVVELKTFWLDLVAHAFNPITREAEAGSFL